MEQTKLNKYKALYARLKAQEKKLHKQGNVRYKRLLKIQKNIIKVENELYSSQNEDIDTIWSLCDKLRELINNEHLQSIKLIDNIRKQNMYESKASKIEASRYGVFVMY